MQVAIFPDLQDVYLRYRDYTTVNDAQCHHIALVCDGENGDEIKLITQSLIASKVEGYGGGRQLPEHAWATLGRPQSGNLKAYTESGFQGHLTKVQIFVTRKPQGRDQRNPETSEGLSHGAHLVSPRLDTHMGRIRGRDRMGRARGRSAFALRPEELPAGIHRRRVQRAAGR